MSIQVAVCGAKGKMGQEVVKTILNDTELELVGVVDAHAQPNETLNDFFGVDSLTGMTFDTHLSELLNRPHPSKKTSKKPQVCIDFTHPGVVFENTMAIIDAGCRPVIGTTGLSADQLQQIDNQLKSKGLGGIVAPNFAIGAILMMKFAQEASRYFEHAEIIELHHNQKADAPSGTALKTAELMQESRAHFGITNAPEKELLPGARGAKGPADIAIHSIRLPGFIAHQEVIFGGPGQILTIRHDGMDRSCFMPGIALAAKKVMALNGLVYGLEHLL